MIAVLEPAELRSDYTPVATAAEQFFTWLPEPYGLLLIVAAAIAAFASTGNAGILSASRYPLAMARDHLVTQRFDALGRFGTPVPAIVVTAGLMVLVIVALDVEDFADEPPRTPGPRACPTAGWGDASGAAEPRRLARWLHRPKRPHRWSGCRSRPWCLAKTC